MLHTGHWLTDGQLEFVNGRTGRKEILPRTPNTQVEFLFVPWLQPEYDVVVGRIVEKK